METVSAARGRVLQRSVWDALLPLISVWVYVRTDFTIELMIAYIIPNTPNVMTNDAANEVQHQLDHDLKWLQVRYKCTHYDPPSCRNIGSMSMIKVHRLSVSTYYTARIQVCILQETCPIASA